MIVQVSADPEHPPDHPANVTLFFGFAVRTTVLPYKYDAAHVKPQLIPDGSLVTNPGPDWLTVTVYGTRLNAAATLTSTLLTTVQGSVPLQAPLHPSNVDPVADTADNVTEVPSGNAAEHVVPQSIPAGFVVTAPVPFPVSLTVSVKVFTGAVPQLSFENSETRLPSKA